jgi:hypothetical protein
MTETLIDSPSLSELTVGNEADLVRRLCHVLDLAARAVSALAPNGYTDAQEPDNNVIPEKIIAETALLLRAASTVADRSEVRRSVESVARLLIPFARSERFALAMCLRPALSMDYAQAHACLTQLGHPDPDFDQLIRQALRADACDGKERVPHRVLEIEWITRIWNGSPTRKAVPGAAYQSVLNRTMDLLHGSREDIYAFTHALMYLKDFNLQPLPLPRSKDLILAEAEAALARCLDEQDYDLAGEVLLSWPLTKTAWSPGSRFAFDLLMKVEDRAGFLPAPVTRLERLRNLDGEAKDRYFLATAYHTIYVMGLLCSSALQFGNALPDAPSSTIRGIGRTILAFLDSESPAPHWREEVERMSEEEVDALAQLLLNVALYRKVKERNYGSAWELLKHADQWGLSSCPYASQTAQLLERLAQGAPLFSPRLPQP